MATVEEHPATNGTATAAGDIAVENPATGEVIAHVPDMPPSRWPSCRARRAPRSPPGRRWASRAARASCAARRSGSSTTPSASSTRSSPRPARPTRTRRSPRSCTAPRLRLLGQARPVYLADERIKTPSPLLKGKRLVLRYRPLGLIGVIGPWNYPLTNSFGDGIPALAAGNAVILKPQRGHPADDPAAWPTRCASAGCPTASSGRHRRGRDRRGAGRRGRHDHVHRARRPPARRSWPRRPRRSPRSSLELGGKDPMIVLADADLERAANAAVDYSMLNAGQTCICVERVYVEAPVYDEFVAMITEKARALRKGRSTGPGHDRRRLDDLPAAGRHRRAARRDAVAKGARVVVGGERGDGAGRPLVRADGAGRRRPHDGVHARGDLRPDAADHEGGRRRGGHPPRQRLPLRPWRLGLHQGRRARRGGGAPHRGRRRLHQRLDVNYTALELPMGGAKASRAWARATAPTASASTPSSRRC